jgi:hypothetical protein
MLGDGRQKWPKVARICGGATGRGGVGGEKKGLTCRTHMSVTVEEKRRGGEIRKPERKPLFGECTKAFLAS